MRGIVEHKDASEAQRQICEIYTGVMAAPARLLKHWLTRLRCDNAQKRVLPDRCGRARRDRRRAVVARAASSATEVAGVNDAAQLAQQSAPTKRSKPSA